MGVLGLVALLVSGVSVSSSAKDIANAPILSGTIGAGGTTTLKGIAIRIGDKQEAAVCFDTELLRVSAGWTGGFVTPLKLMSRGEYPTNQGPIQFQSAARPGWGRGTELKDPRNQPFGPLPADWAKYRGLYLFEDKVVLAYRVGAVEVFESPEYDSLDGVFSRTFNVGKSDQPLMLLVCQAPPRAKGSRIVERVGNGTRSYLALQADVGFLTVGILGGPKEATWEVQDGHLYLKLPPVSQAIKFKIMLRRATNEDGISNFSEYVYRDAPFLDPKLLCRGGAARWTNSVVTLGEQGASTDAYAVDTLTVPDDNPYQSEMLLAGLDFFSDGRAAVSTFHGDVWIVSGLDDKLGKLTWKRFAGGLFHPLGLKIVKDVIHVPGRDQITRLHDLDGDGEADYYENFNNDCLITANFHEFALDLQTDPQGNFYFAKAGPVNNGGKGFQQVLDHHGCLFKLPPDGSKLEVVATGFRAPNGIGVGPHGELTVGDNEGSWMPADRLNWIKPGGFYGCVDTAHRNPRPTQYDGPLCWLPMSVDNSNGGQVWVTTDKWGPFQGELLFLSYGTCSLFKVLKEEVDGEMQGGVVRFPLNFNSGLMRARFNPRDGQLYVVGLKGWGTTAAKTGGFQRVRYTGKPVRLPAELHVTQRGVTVRFTCALDPATANDPQNYAVSQWNYIWSASYGSPEISTKAKNRLKQAEDGKEWSREQLELRQHDEVTIKSVKLSNDQRTVFLEIPDLKPVMQMKIKYNLDAADGASLRQEIYHTIHRLGKGLN